MRLYSYRPAPVQVHYLGGTGALSMRSIDWRLADEITEPSDCSDRANDAIYRISGGIHAFEPLKASAPLSNPPCLENGYITFGCLNGLQKFEKHTFRLWAEVLEACPRSRLLIIKDLFRNKNCVDHFMKFASSQGIPSDRLDLRHAKQGESHADLSVYHAIDIALDTGPYNGITTTCEALWMGVPVVTLLGNRFVAREATALIQQTGYSEWIAQSPSEYVHICQNLAQSAQNIEKMRPIISQRFKNSPACDPKRLAREFVEFCTFASKRA